MRVANLSPPHIVVVDIHPLRANGWCEHCQLPSGCGTLSMQHLFLNAEACTHSLLKLLY